MAGAARIGRDRVVDVATAARFGSLGHAATLLLLFALPIAVLGVRLIRRPATVGSDERFRFCLFTALVIGSLVVVATVFTAAIAGHGPYETTGRLHLRYYDFALPLLIVVGAIGAESAAREKTWRRRLAVVCSIGVVWATVVGFAGIVPNVVDSPDVLAVALHPTTRRLAGALGLATLATWVVRPRVGAAVFIVAAVPWLAWKAAWEAEDQFAAHRVPTAYDRAGVVARAVGVRGGAGTVRVFGDDASGVYRAMFRIDDARSSWTLLAPHQPVTPDLWRSDERWAVVVGDHDIAFPHVVETAGDGIVVVRRADAK